MSPVATKFTIVTIYGKKTLSGVYSQKNVVIHGDQIFLAVEWQFK